MLNARAPQARSATTACARINVPLLSVAKNVVPTTRYAFTENARRNAAGLGAAVAEASVVTTEHARYVNLMTPSMMTDSST